MKYYNFDMDKKNLSVYEIFRRNQQAAYPELLAKYIENPNAPAFEIEKAEMLLNIWTDEYKLMPQINKSTYYNYIPRFLKYLYSIYVNKNRGAQSFSTMYYIFYKKWTQATALIKKGLRQNNMEILILLWKISFNMIKAITQIDRQQYGLFLSQQFQEPLSKYKWNCHAQKMYILQILKYINNDILYDAFIENGKQWSSVIKAMKDQQFKSQIIPQKQGELRLKVFKYEYQQSKKEKKTISALSSTHTSMITKSDKKKEAKQKTPFQKQMEKKLQKELLNREQINMFLVVKDKQEQQQIYRLQLLSEIISNRPLLSKICEQFWDSLALQIIQQCYKKLETLNAQNKMDVILAKVFLGLLRYRKTSHIIKQKIGEQIVVRIISNIETLQKKSPFQTPTLGQIPPLVNKSFFQITPDMANQGVTLETLINKRIKSIIDQANGGKDDIVSRSLMTVICKDQIILKQPILKEIVNFFLNIKKKKNLFIQTCIFLSKILFSAFQSPDFKQFNMYILSLLLTQISDLFQNNKKLNQLRKINIQLLELYLPIVADDQKIDEISKIGLIESTLKFLQNSQKNFQFFFCPIIFILRVMINQYRDILLTQYRSMDFFSKIIFGMREKLQTEHKSQNMFAFLDCILKAYVQLQWDQAYNVYEQMPEEYYREWEVIYRKQAQILFKKEDQLKWNRKVAAEKANKEKNQKVSKYNKKEQDSKKPSGLGQIDQAVEKKCQQKMTLYFGKLEIKWFKDLINDHDIWAKQQIIKAELAILQFSLIQTVESVQKQYYIKSQSPNKYIKNIILQLDEDLHNLFAYLIDSQIYQLLFMFASQIFFLCRDFFFVIELKSFRILQSKCFQILSVFFNKVEILYACSTFSSLFLPFFNNPKQLKRVYDSLNNQQFITDLFKGSNQFIGKQKCYYPWLIKILMAYQVTQQYRQDKKLIKQALISLGKNVAWWGNVDYLVNAEIQVDEQSKQSRILVFEIFKQQYKKMMAKYYDRVQSIIQVQKKTRELVAQVLFEQKQI